MGAALSCLGLASTGCETLIPNNMLTNGEVRTFRVDDDDRLLYGAWKGAESAAGGIPTARNATTPGEENFLVSFDTGFVKYLPDPGGVNEVVVVFTFSDGPPEKDEDRIVKILGPMRRQPDGALLPEVSRLTFGPTSLQSEYLSVQIDVVEFDREEAEDNAALLDLLGNAAGAFSAADPVTAAEIALVQEIGKILVATNQNDIVLSTRFDLCAYDAATWSDAANHNVMALPLRTGSFGVLQIQKPFFLYTFFPFSRRLDFQDEPVVTAFTLPFSAVADIVALPFTGLLRGFTDLPDTASMSDVVTSGPGGAMQELRGNGATKTVHLLSSDADTRYLMAAAPGGAAAEVYRSKTWLTFSVSRGHDPLPIAARKRLTEAEQKIVGMLKRRSLREIIDESRIDEAIADLAEARREAEASGARGGFRFTVPAGGSIDTAKSLEIQAAKPRDAEISAVKLVAIDVGSTALPDPIAATLGAGAVDRTIATIAAPGSASEVPIGKYEVSFEFARAGSPRVERLPLKVVRKPEIELHADAKQAGLKWAVGSALAVCTATKGDFAEVTQVTVACAGTKSGSAVDVTLKADRNGKGTKIEASQISLTNDSGVEIHAIKAVTLRRKHGLSEVVLPVP